MCQQRRYGKVNNLQVLFKNLQMFSTTSHSYFTFIRFVPTFVRYSCDGVSVQHSIQEGVRRLSDLEKQKRRVTFINRVA